MSYFRKGIIGFLVIIFAVTLSGVTGVGQKVDLGDNQFVEYTVDDFKFLNIQGEYDENTILIKYEKQAENAFLSFMSSINIRNEDLFKGTSISDYREMNFSIVEEDTLFLSVSEGEMWYLATIEEGKTVTDVLIELARVDGVLQAEPNYLFKTSEYEDYELIPESSLTNDPQLLEQYYLDLVGIQESRDHLVSLGINPGGSSSVVVAVIDTGVDYTHPDLAANMWINTGEIANNGIDDDGNGYVDDVYGIDATNDNVAYNGNPMDNAGHGTHVAGIIAADGDNGVGTRGVADNVKIMALKAGESEYLSAANIVESLNYAVSKGADVINMSFGSFTRSTAVEDALAIAFSQAVLVAAAGNQAYINEPHIMGKNMYPAAYPWVIGVMADNGTSTALFSNYDYIPEDASEYQITAPGVDILSTLPNGEYAKWDGTSMSTPIVSGIAALLRSKFDDKSMYSSRFIMGQLVGTSETEIIPPQMSNWETYYQVNAFDALTKLPEPSLSFFEYYIIDDTTIAPENDGDGIIDAGETIYIAITIRNQWGQSSDTIVTIDSISAGGVADPFVTLITDSVDYGKVGSFSSDDNGIIYNDEKRATGIENPFIVKIADDTPNDHHIRFNVTITANNGLNLDDTTEYVFDEQYFVVTTRAGSEVTTVISEDTILTNDKLWIIDNTVLIEEGVTLTIEPGTQVQFWSSNEEDFYATPKIAQIEVRGQLIIQGTPDQPVELFPSDNFQDFEVRIDRAGNGRVDIQYASIVNPNINANVIDHVYFTQNYDYMKTYYYSSGEVYQTWTSPYVSADIITNSIFTRLFSLGVNGKLYGNLFDSVGLNFNVDYAENNVFLNNFAYNVGQLGEMTNINRSNANIYNWYNDNDIYINTNKIFRNEENGKTYVIVYSNATVTAIERYADYLGGTLAIFNSAEEKEYINNNIDDYKVSLGLKYDYFSQTYNWIDGTDSSNIEVTQSYYSYMYFAEYATYHQGEYYTDSSSYYLLEIDGEIYVNDILFDTENILIGDQTTDYQIQYSLIPFTSSRSDLVWTSNDELIVTVDQFGIINPVGLGETIITVETNDGVISKEITVTVIETIPLTNMTMGSTFTQMNINEQQRLLLSFEPYNTTERAVDWVSDNEAIATIDEFGNVTGHAVGTVTITATSKDGLFTVSTTIDVVVPVEEIYLEEDFATYSMSDFDVALGASVYPFNATNQNLVWKSSDEDIAYIDEFGLLQPVSPGNVVIRVYAENTNIYDDIIVNITESDVQVKRVVDAAIGGYDGGESFIYTLMEDGSVWYFGRNDVIVPKQVTGLSDIIQIDAKYHNGYALKADGTVWYMNGLSTSQISGFTDITQIVAQADYLLALKSDGTVWGRGSNYQGTLGPKDNTWFSNPVQINDVTNVQEISATGFASIFLLKDGTVKYLQNGEINILSEVVDVTGLEVFNSRYQGYDYVVFYTDTDFKVYQFNESTITQRTEFETGISGETIIEVGSNAEYDRFIVVLTTDGDVYTKWHNTYGTLGIGVDSGEINYLDYFVKVDLENIVNIEVGINNAIAIDVDGNLFIWGANGAHQIADFTTETQYEPFKVSFGLTYESNPPQVETSSPNDYEIEVDVNGDIILNYDEAIYKSHNFNYITLTNQAGSIISITKTIDLNRIVISPIAPLRFGESYKLTVQSSSVQDMFGNRSEPLEIRFTTEQLIYLNRTNVTVDINSTSETILYSINEKYNGGIIWTSLDETIVTVVDGVLYPVTEGTTSVLVSTSDGKYVRTINVVVKNVVPITSINIIEDSIKVNTQEQQQIQLEASPSNYNEDIIWISSDKSIAVIDEYGNVYGVSSGTVIVTAQNKAGTVLDTIDVQVIEPITSVEIEDEFKVLNIDDLTTTLSARVYPDTATYQTIIWESSDETIATVDEFGVVTLLGAGTVVIRATGLYSDIFDQIVLFVSNDISDEITVVDVAMTQFNANQETYVLLSDGSVWLLGNYSDIPVKQDISNIVDIEATYYNVFAINGDGHLLRFDSWNNQSYRVGNLENIVNIAGYDNTFTVLLNDGTVWGWGNNQNGQLTDLSVNWVDEWNPVQILGLTNIIDIEVVRSTTIFLKNDGDIYYRGTSQNVSTTAKITEITNIEYLNVGTNYGWDNSIMVAFDINGESYPIKFTMDENIELPVYEIREDLLPDSMPGLLKEAVIYDGSYIYLNDLGDVYSYGINTNGELGLGNFDNTEILTQVDISNIEHIYSGEDTTFAISYSGELYAWGKDGSNMITDFKSGNVNTPTRIYFGIEEDNVAPSVINSSIPNESEISELHPIIEINFNEYVEAVFESDIRAIKIYDSQNNEISAYKYLGLNSLEVQVLQDLTYGETYHLVIPYYTLQDRFGNVLADYELTFKVGDFINLEQSYYKIDTNEESRQIIYNENPNFDQEVIWSSQNETVVTVDQNGLMTPVGEGVAVIYVTSADGVYTSVVMVYVLTIIPVETITFDQSNIDVPINTSKQLNPNLIPFSTNEDLRWTSSDDSIATVDEFGVVRGLTNGTVNITVSNLDETVSGVISVRVVTAVEEVALDEEFMVAVLTETPIPMNWMIYPVTATNQNVVWLSSNESVAYVDELGELHTLSTGTAVIRVQAVGTEIYDDIIVTVSESMVETNVVQVSGEMSSTNHGEFYVLMSDKTVWYFGGGNTLLPRKVNISDVVQIESRGYDTLALNSDGIVYYLNQTSASKVNGLTDIVEVGVSGRNYLALKSDGTVWGWGDNYFGQLADKSTDHIYSPIQLDGVVNVVEIEAGYYASIFRYSDGSIKYFNQGVLNDFTEVENVQSLSMTHSRYNSHDRIIFHYDGLEHDIYHFTDTSYSVFNDFDTSFAGLEIVDYDGTKSYDRTFIVTADGELYAKGENDYGILGLDDTEYRSEFEQVDIENVESVHIFGLNTIVITTSGELYIWGFNGDKQITDFTIEPRLTPFRVYFGLQTEMDYPNVESSTPDYNDIEVDIDGNIIIDFDEAVYISSEYAYIKMMDSTGSIISITKTLNLDQLIIDPINNLKYGETYTITLPYNSVKDIFNNSSSSFELRFSTEDLIYTNRNNITLDINGSGEAIEYTVNDKYAGELTWTSSDESIVTVVDGYITPVAEGSVTIFVSSADNTYTKAINIEVINIIPIISIDITEDTMIVNAKDLVKIERTINPSDYNEDIIWTSGNLEVATVNEFGYVYGFHNGEVIITAQNKDGLIIDSILVTVIEPVDVVVIEDEYRVVNTTETNVVIEASVYPETATNKNLVWQSSDIDVATVDQDGNVTIVGVGNVVIRAQAENSAKLDEITLFISDEVLSTTKAIDVAIYGTDWTSLVYVLLDNGDVWSFGAGQYEMPQKIDISNVSELGGYAYGVYAITNDGRLFELQQFIVSEKTGFPEGTTVTDVASNGYFTLALLNDGTVYGWGTNENAQIADSSIASVPNPTQIPGVTGIIDVEVGFTTAIFVDSNGDVFYRGGPEFTNEITQITELSNITSVEPNVVHHFWNRYDIFTFVDINNNYIPSHFVATGYEFDDVYGDGGIEGNLVQVSSTNYDQNYRHILYLNDLGEVYAKGNNDYGQLGIIDAEYSSEILYKVDLENIVKVFALKYNSFAIDASGALYVWGNDDSRQVPDMEYGSQYTPYRVYFGMQRDLEAPYIDEIIPDISTSINIDSPILIDFNEYVTASSYQLKYVVILDSSGVEVPSMKEMGIDTLVITPLEDLKYGETYTIIIPDYTIRDNFSNSLPYYEQTFSTEDFIYLTQSNYRVDLNSVSRQILFESNPNYIGNNIWTSSDETIITVDQNGLMVAISEGTTTITVSTEDGLYTKVINVEVLNIIPIETIEFDPIEVNVNVNTSKVLTPIITPITYNEDVHWSSNDTSVVTVSEDGIVTGLDNGTAVITVSNLEGNIVGEITVNVIVPVSSMEFTEDFMPVVLAEANENMIYTVGPENATIKTIYWQSSDESIAYVDEFGELQKVSSGTVVIRGTVVGTEIYDEIVVTVSETASFNANVIDTMITRSYVYALMDDGSVWYWGGSVLLPRKVNVANITTISGDNDLYALDSNGLVFRISGINSYQQEGLSDIVEISSSYYYNLALKEDGTVWAWGNNDYYVFNDSFNGSTSTPIQVQGLTDIIDIAANRRSSTYLKDNGTLVYRGNSQTGFTEVDNVFNVASIAIDYNYDNWANAFVSVVYTDDSIGKLNCDNGNCTVMTIEKIGDTETVSYDFNEWTSTRLILNDLGEVYMYGSNGSGELGNGTTDHVYSYVQVELPSIVKAKVDYYISTAITADGELYMWGRNNDRQIPNLTTENVLEPFKVVFGIEFDEETPYVEETNLSALKTNEPIEIDLEIDFSKALKEASQYIFVSLKDSQNILVGVELELVLDKLYVRPINDLKYGETYTMYIPSNSLVDVFNNYLPEQNITFTTESFVTVTKSSYRIDLYEVSRAIEYTVNSKYTGDVNFTTLNELIATVDESGNITPVSVGTTAILITDDQGLYVETINVEIIELIPIIDIDITENLIIIGKDESKTIEYTLNPTDANEDLVWISTDESIAYIDEFGTITGITSGSTTITLENTDGTISDTVTIDVVVSVEEVVVEDEFLLYSLDLVTYDNITASVLPLDATIQDIEWQSANSDIAYIDSNGDLQLIGVGTVVLRAISPTSGMYDDIMVSVSETVLEDLNAVDVTISNYNGRSIFVLMDNGTLWTWGRGYDGVSSELKTRLVPEQVAISDIEAIYSNDDTVGLLKTDGTVWMMGRYAIGDGSYHTYTFTQVPDLTNVIDLSISSSGKFALKSDGTVWAWGNEYNSPVFQINGLSNIVEMSTSNQRGYFLDSEGSLYYLNSFEGTPVLYEEVENVKVLSDAYESHYIYISDLNNRLYVLDFEGGYHGEQSINIENTLNIISITNRYTENVVVVLDDGSTLTWGYQNTDCMIGDSRVCNNSWLDSYNANPLDISTGIVKADVTYFMGAAIDVNGDVFVWGINTENQLQDFTWINSSTPNQVYFGIQTDDTIPVLMSPATTGADPITVGGDIEIDFNEAIYRSDEYNYIRLRDINGNLLAYEKSIELDKIVINPLVDLEYDSTYTIEIPSNALTDMFQNIYAGTTITLTTEAGTAPSAIEEELVRDVWTAARLSDKFTEFIELGMHSSITHNAILNNLYDLSMDTWLQFTVNNECQYDECKIYYTNNYWGTTDKILIENHVFDYDDIATLTDIVTTPFLLESTEQMYPHVSDVIISTDTEYDVMQVGPEPITITVKFNRDMSVEEQLGVYFGPDFPYTDFQVIGNWVDSKTWVGEVNITPITGDGKQFLRITNGFAVDDNWLKLGDDDGRFMFEIITSGTESMNLQANGSEGRVELEWAQNDFDLLAGYNIYRSESIDGTYTKVNVSVIPGRQLNYTDYNVESSQLYFYKFTVVRTDFTESDYSNVAYGASFDTIAPVLGHNPVLSANVDQEIYFTVQAQDNNKIEYVDIYYRHIGESVYNVMNLINVEGDNYTGKISANNVKLPGIEYYVVVSDGLTEITKGNETTPLTITVNDNPTIVTLYPVVGVYTGGTEVTINGTNFKDGAKVYFSNIEITNVTYIDNGTLKVIVPEHYPAFVDVKVVNPSGATNTRYSAFEYYSSDSAITVDTVKSGKGTQVILPISVDNLHGFIAGDFTFQYDNSVLEFVEVTKGGLTSRFSLVTNSNVAGQLIVSMANSTAISGSGELIYLLFNVRDSSTINYGETTNVLINDISLNGESISMNIYNGGIEIANVFSVSGSITYFGNGGIVDNVSLILDGAIDYNSSTDYSGNFTIQQIENDSYTLSAFKDSDDVNGITAFDATKVLQAAAGLITLNEFETLAADVNSDGVVNSMDASQILEFAAGLRLLPFEGTPGVWKFNPDTIEYDNLSNNQTNQNITAVLVGDVSGNYISTSTSSNLYSDGVVQISNFASTEEFVSADFEVKYYDFDLYSFETTLLYDETTQFSHVVFDTSFENCMVVINDQVPGVLRIVVACAYSIDLNGTAFSVYFTNTTVDDQLTLVIQGTLLNEVGNITELMNVYNITPSSDFNNDGVVDASDIQLLIDIYNETYRSSDISKYDFNSDGIVDIYDIIKSQNNN